MIGAVSLAGPGAPPAADSERETQVLLDKLKVAGEQVVANIQSPQAYRFHLEQGDVLMKLAARCKPEERDSWLRMAIDSYASAAGQAPQNVPQADQWLAQIAVYIAKSYPTSAVGTYITYKEVHTNHLRTVMKEGEDAGKANDRLCEWLMDFARRNPQAPEAPKAVLEVAEALEAVKKIDGARDAYRFLSETYATGPLAKACANTLARGTSTSTQTMSSVNPTHAAGMAGVTAKDARLRNPFAGRSASRRAGRKFATFPNSEPTHAKALPNTAGADPG
jgi:hypothetical protein